jgi:hypothetical protein
MVSATPRGYPQRQDWLPETMDGVDAPWLTQILRNRYPGISVDTLERLELIQGHTTKLRVSV